MAIKILLGHLQLHSGQSYVVIWSCFRK